VLSKERKKGGKGEEGRKEERKEEIYWPRKLYLFGQKGVLRYSLAMVAQAGLQLIILLFPQCWDYRHPPPIPTSSLLGGSWSERLGLWYLLLPTCLMRWLSGKACPQLRGTDWLGRRMQNWTQPFTSYLSHDQLLFPRPQCFPQKPFMVCFSNFSTVTHSKK
jgi:hypothetical protein